MIGHYVHHVGSGHLHRATAVARALGEPVTGLSSLPRPHGWEGPWLRLDEDLEDEPLDPTARGRLHWVPLGHAGLRARMAQLSSWIARAEPSVMIVDVSVEAAVLARLHGVPVVTVAVPGERGDDAHRLGFDLAEVIVGCWPPVAAGMLPGLAPHLLDRVVAVGGLSRFPAAERGPRRPGRPRVVLLSGAGGHDLDRHDIELARKETPDWDWTVLDRELGEWVHDPFAALLDADVAVTQAGQNALAEVAAARVPAVVVPQARPHREQHVTAAALRREPWPAVVLDEWPATGWPELLAQASALDGATWSLWCDGHAAERFADIVRAVASGRQP